MGTVCTGLFRSSLGKKYLMALSGLIWLGFVFGHMAGNFLLFVSAEAFNKYSHAIVSNPALPLIEAVLLLSILMHAFLGIKLTLENKAARPQGYAVGPADAKRASVASRTMAYTGSIVLVFIILHIAAFKYGTHYDAVYNGVEMRDIHRLVVESFHQTGFVAWYVVALLFLGVHLSHGFSSAFQSLGINHPRYTRWIKCAGCVYAVVVALGFISQPVYVYFFSN